MKISKTGKIVKILKKQHAKQSERERNIFIEKHPTIEKKKHRIRPNPQKENVNSKAKKLKMSIKILNLIHPLTTRYLFEVTFITSH